MALGARVLGFRGLGLRVQGKTKGSGFTAQFVGEKGLGSRVPRRGHNNYLPQ